MRIPRRILSSCAFLAVLSVAPAIERLPIEDFASPPATARARLSPDGQRLSFLREINGQSIFHIIDLSDGKISRLDLGDAALVNDLPKEVGSYSWIGNERLLITTTVQDSLYGVIAVNWNGNKGKAIGGYEDGRINVGRGKFFAREVVHRYFDKDHNILMLDRHSDGGGGSPNRPDIVRVNTMTGTRKTMLKNPGEVARYGLDRDGVARLGILSHGELSGAVYRPDEKSPWQTIMPLQRRDGQMHPLGLDPTGGLIYVSDLTAEKRRGVFTMDPATGRLSDPLMSDPKYDIIPERMSPAIDGLSLAGPIHSDATETLLGIRYYTEAPRVKWFDPDYMKYQAAVDKALPHTVNLLVNQTLDGKKLLWLAFSDQDPGSYHLLDLKAKTFKPLGARMPWIKPDQMAPTHSIQYEARDGLTIHGYLTVPQGHQPKGLPLVVKPHGGPWVRDAWGFDPLVQLLANRGYAVLQMNYRGSTGYGDELYREAKKQIGGKIQDDIEDAARWAIAAGVADPQRIAILGMSYGGYSALFALGHNPGLYRCGVSMAGVTDWPALYEDSDVAENKMAKKYWRDQVGDPKDDLDRLRAISPVNFANRITAPVLIIQGKQDQRVPQNQAKRMIAALEKEGRPPESLILGGVGHNFGQQRHRVQIFQSVVDFLEKHLGPGVL